MPDFTRIISMAYLRILERLPDPGGLDSYNQLMNSGSSEARIREALLRSPEYAEKNPGLGPAAAARAARAAAAKTGSRRKKSKTRKAR